MAVYVSLIPKYKCSQAKGFLVKPKAELCPASDRVSQAGSQHGQFFGWQEAGGGGTALVVPAVPGGTDGLGHPL